MSYLSFSYLKHLPSNSSRLFFQKPKSAAWVFRTSSTMTPTVILSTFPDDPSRRQIFYVYPGAARVTFDSNGRPSNPNWSWYPQLKSTFAPLRRFDINDLPVEIRILIFRQYLVQWEPSRFTPPLIKALRPDPQLYHEALDIYYSLKLCSTPRTGERAKAISRSVLRRACSLRVWYR